VSTDKTRERTEFDLRKAGETAHRELLDAVVRAERELGRGVWATYRGIRPERYARELAEALVRHTDALRQLLDHLAQEGLLLGKCAAEQGTEEDLQRLQGLALLLPGVDMSAAYRSRAS
jgi:hypothetical protein